MKWTEAQEQIHHVLTKQKSVRVKKLSEILEGLHVTLVSINSEQLEYYKGISQEKEEESIWHKQ